MDRAGLVIDTSALIAVVEYEAEALVPMILPRRRSPFRIAQCTLNV
jgi:hypothetical protein